MIGKIPRINFSKLIMALVMAAYFYGVAVGSQVVRQSPEYLEAYLAYLGAPTAIAMTLYSTKALRENVKKIEFWGPPKGDAE